MGKRHKKKLTTGSVSATGIGVGSLYPTGGANSTCYIIILILDMHIIFNVTSLNNGYLHTD